MNIERLRWWEITGYSYLDKEHQHTDSTFIFFVEALSRNKAAQKMKGVQHCEDHHHRRVAVYFPEGKGKIRVHARNWSPKSMDVTRIENESTVVRIIPAVRYVCECGEVRVSERRYPSMWCSCGKKAYPAEKSKSTSTGLRDFPGISVGMSSDKLGQEPQTHSVTLL
ncbi:hypothetical protein LLE49_03570 [Alicyclobacillus tolerans]|uniref:hypothetical protein n=1 Tax=Alicyclobacillus tolerans TaxID=90970 RepID=UPI001F442125|nr:hypothetical protein [Alicyclobacillus tolerans]MCF8563818.1 hypothetical protein [Alicyclobacillus tolerans]